MERASGLLAQLQGVRGAGDGRWVALCPAHEDRRQSLSIREQPDGRLLLHCHAGCETEQVAGALGLRMADLAPPGTAAPARENGRARAEIAATYDYHDATGVLRYQVVRLRPKGFRQRRPDGHGGWTWNLDGVERLLYRLPAVLTDAAFGERVYVVEGERDADALIALGLSATTNAGGAGKWLDSYSEALRGAAVVVLPDADDAGREHAQAVARSLAVRAASVRVLELPGLPAKGDVSDWLASGGTPAELERLADAAAEWSPASVNEQAASVNEAPPPCELLTLATVRPEVVRWLWHDRIPLGKLTVLDGDPGLGKSLLTLDLAARISTGQEMPDGTASNTAGPAGVILMTLEDDPADTLVPRLLAAGADLQRVHCLLQVRGADEERVRPVHLGDLAALEHAITTAGASLLVVDPLMAYLPREIDSHRDQDVRAVLGPLAQLAQRTGAAVLLVRHLNKTAAGNALYRGGGSVGIIGAVRSGMVVAPDRADRSRRVLAMTKSNLAAPAPSLAYRIAVGEGAPAVTWEGEVGTSADDLFGFGLPGSAGERGQADESAIATARYFLLEILSAGPVLAQDLKAAAREQGIAVRTLQRAREDLGIESRVPSGNRQSEWFIPEAE